VLFLTCTASLAAEQLTGTVDVRTRAGATRGTVLVFAEPLDAAASRHPVAAQLVQKDKTFSPGVLAVPVGSTVEFPNRDPIFHNVFSLSTPQPFDLGLYRAGSSKSRVFTAPGYYWVFCNIHPQMAAFLAIVPSPWWTTAGPNGEFRLEVPRGRYRLTAVSERAAPISLDAAAAAPSPLVLRLDETAWVGITHKNKFGQDYPASAYEESRRRHR
jgi:plastocyanin